MLLNHEGAKIESGIKGELVRVDLIGPYRDPAWDEALAQLDPPEDRDKLTSLKLVWVPGDPWQPVERWVIYQMYPVGVIPSFIDEKELKGPDPRTYAGDWDSVLGRFVRIQELTIDRMQWKLYQETEQYGFPYWVVQGKRGGHLRRFTHVQKALSKLEGGWEDPPAPGDLPYLAPNNLTWEGLREQNLLAVHEGLLALHLRTPQMVQGDMAKRAREMRQRMWNQLKSEQEALWGDEKGVIRDLRDASPVGVGKSTGPDYEAIERRFIEED